MLRQPFWPLRPLEWLLMLKAATAFDEVMGIDVDTADTACSDDTEPEGTDELEGTDDLRAWSW